MKRVVMGLAFLAMIVTSIGCGGSSSSAPKGSGTDISKKYSMEPPEGYPKPGASSPATDKDAKSDKPADKTEKSDKK